MKGSLLHFSGLYGETQTTLFPNFIHHESLETRSKLYNWEIHEHIHTELFQMFLIHEGKGKLISEKTQLTFEGPSIILIPANNLHGFSFEPTVQGEVLTFSESILEHLFMDQPKVLWQSQKLQVIAYLGQNEAYEKVMTYKNLVVAEWVEENLEKKTAIQLLFKLLFIQIFRFTAARASDISTQENRQLNYFRSFQKSIKQYALEGKTVQAYAKELGITTVHLNRICNTVAGQSALAIIHGHLIADAKKYLLNTAYSISEISYLLNFKDPAYFTRLFKKYTSVSPSDFRKI